MAFQEKLLEVFEEPDMATAYLNALATVTQDREYNISKYMHRVRLLVLMANPNLKHSARERILITSFMLELHDKQLAASLAVVKVQTAGEAERLAAEGEAVRRDQKSRKSSGNYFIPSTNREAESENEEDLNLSEEGEEKELMATLADFKARPGNSTKRRVEIRDATISTKCYNCGQLYKWTLQAKLPPTKEIKVYGRTSNPTLSNRVSTVLGKPLCQRVHPIGNGETTSQ